MREVHGRFLFLLLQAVVQAPKNISEMRSPSERQMLPLLPACFILEKYPSRN